MYYIVADHPATFSASTLGGATWDTQLFVFTEAGVGVTMNDDSDGLQSLLGAFDTCPYSAGPGLYFAAISRYNADPHDAAAGVFWVPRVATRPMPTRSQVGRRRQELPVAMSSRSRI
jgi:hypothetical protein